MVRDYGKRKGKLLRWVISSLGFRIQILGVSLARRLSVRPCGLAGGSGSMGPVKRSLNSDYLNFEKLHPQNLCQTYLHDKPSITHYSSFHVLLHYPYNSLK